MGLDLITSMALTSKILEQLCSTTAHRDQMRSPSCKTGLGCRAHLENLAVEHISVKILTAARGKPNVVKSSSESEYTLAEPDACLLEMNSLLVIGVIERCH